MKKAFAILINSLNGGGAERMVSRISEPLSQQYELYILTLYVTEKDYKCAGHIIHVGGDGGYYKRVWHCIRNLNRLIRENRIICVMSFLQVPDLVNILINHNCKRVINLRGFQSLDTTTCLSNKIKYMLCVLFYRFADGVIAVSKELKEDCSRRFRVPEKKCYAIENFCEIETNDAETLSDKNVLSFIDNHKTLVSVGRLVWTKNYEELLYVVQRIRKEIPEIGLLILGEGEARTKLEKLAGDLEVSENVLFAGNKKNPTQYVKRCAMYVSLSFFEGFPNALLEAMMCGIPVLHAACQTGPTEMLTGDFKAGDEIDRPIFAEYGILTPDCLMIKEEEAKAKNRDALAGSIIRILNDKVLADEYGRRAKLRAQQYSKDKCIEKYVRVIEKVIG